VPRHGRLRRAPDGPWRPSAASRSCVGPEPAHRGSRVSPRAPPRHPSGTALNKTSRLSARAGLRAAVSAALPARRQFPRPRGLKRNDTHARRSSSIRRRRGDSCWARADSEAARSAARARPALAPVATQFAAPPPRSHAQARRCEAMPWSARASPREGEAERPALHGRCQGSADRKRVGRREPGEQPDHGPHRPHHSRQLSHRRRRRPAPGGHSGEGAVAGAGGIRKSRMEVEQDAGHIMGSQVDMPGRALPEGSRACRAPTGRRVALRKARIRGEPAHLLWLRASGPRASDSASGGVAMIARPGRDRDRRMPERRPPGDPCGPRQTHSWALLSQITRRNGGSGPLRAGAAPQLQAVHPMDAAPHGMADAGVSRWKHGLERVDARTMADAAAGGGAAWILGQTRSSRRLAATSSRLPLHHQLPALHRIETGLVSNPDCYDEDVNVYLAICCTRSSTPSMSSSRRSPLRYDVDVFRRFASSSDARIRYVIQRRRRLLLVSTASSTTGSAGESQGERQPSEEAYVGRGKTTITSLHLQPQMHAGTGVGEVSKSCRWA